LEKSAAANKPNHAGAAELDAHLESEILVVESGARILRNGRNATGRLVLKKSIVNS